MADSLHSILQNKGFTAEKSYDVRSTVTTSENGKRYCVHVKDLKASVVYQIDGYIISDKNVNKCDKMVLIDHGGDVWTQILVELKGTNILHAMKQLKATIENPALRNSTNKIIRARVVGRSFPTNRANPDIERERSWFSKKNCNFKTLKTNQDDDPV